MYILGISAFYHDSAACLIKDGKIIAAAQEERFTRIKHDSSFPKNAIKYCLNEFDIKLKDIEKISFYDDPILKFKRILYTYKTFFPQSIPFIFKSLPIWLTKKLYWKKNLINYFIQEFNVKIDRNKIFNTTHHQSHAASAFYPSPFKESAVLILDGVGEFETVTIWKGKDNKLEKIYNINFPHSLGLLYSAFTYYLGFKVNSGEYKVMGLAPYGKPKYVKLIKDNLINIKDNGSFKLNMDYFNFPFGITMTNERFHNLFGKQPRKRESELTQFHMDIAASIQVITEEIMIKLATFTKKLTKSDNLCLAGGVALNCVGNGKIMKKNIFKNIWIQPASGDAGGAIGAALNLYYQEMNNKRIINQNEMDKMQGSYLGPKFNKNEIEKYLNSVSAKYKYIKDEDRLIEIVANELANGKVVGWHYDRMEFGPRALGHRSILGDPRNPNMQSIMNLKIKHRESFRPFAPSVLKEKVNEWFEINTDSPYMLLVANVKKDKQIPIADEEQKLFGIEKLRVIRSKIPAVTHIDYSSRIQTVHKETNLRYWKLIKKFEELTGCPVLINTSFNVRGEPIVCTPEDSYRCFMRTEMDILVIDDFLLYKEEQPKFKDKGNWQDEFELD
jgi:carbamoyltransferase